MAGWEIQYLPILPGKFEAWFSDRGVPHGVIQWESWNTGMQLMGTLRRDLVPIAIPIGSSGLFQNICFKAGDLIFMKPGSELNFRTTSPVQLLTFHVPQLFLEDIGSQLGIENPMALLSDSQVVESDSFLKQTWLMNLLTLYQIPSEFPSAREEMESQMFFLFWEYLSNQYGRKSRFAQRPTASLRPIKRAQEFVEENLTKTIRLEDIVAESGTSARMLQLGFRKFFQMTPTQYLRWRRMHSANRTLQQASKNCLTVTQVAMKYGFFHLGRFSMAYHNMFGEYPNETLNSPRSRGLVSRSAFS